jgi:hypothetical protein
MAEEILLLSDMHVMSNWALIHPDFVGKDIKNQDVQYIPNAIQDWTFKKWERMANQNKNITAIGYNGDIIDGINNYNYGAVANTDPLQQIKMAVMLAKMLPDVPTYVMGGTPYHSGSEITAEQIFAEMLGAEYAMEAIIEECGIRIFANHYVPHSQNKAATLEKRIKMMKASESCYGPIDVLWGAHNHEFTAVQTTNCLGLLTPGWQSKTPYAIRRNLITPPDIGYVKLIIEDKELISVDKRGVETSPFGCPVLCKNPIDELW